MKFQYTARDNKNKKKAGEIQANNQGEALRFLKEQGLFPLSLENASDLLAKPKSIWQREIGNKNIYNYKANKKNILNIANQMAMMIKAGVNLSTAMEILIDSEKNKNLKLILQEVKEDLNSGINIASSMAKFKAFPLVMVNILAAGEFNGKLDSAFESSAKVIEKEVAMSNKLKNAMSYPIMLSFITFFVVIILNFVVLPTFVDMFAQYGADLPRITILVLGLSAFLGRFWWVLLFSLVVLVLLYLRAMKKNKLLAIRVAHWKLQIPLVGQVLKQVYTARFCRVMSSLVYAGVEIIGCLTLSRNVMPNLYLRDSIDQVIEGVRIGIPIHQTLEDSRVFEPLLISMIRVGEESGDLADTLIRMADLYEAQSDNTIQRMSQLLEPSLTVILALVVGVVIISIVLPMFGIYSIIG